MANESPTEKRADANEAEEELDKLGMGEMLRHPGRAATDDTPSPADDSDVQAPG